jgi:SAM-dependent methyltransferase
VSAAHFIVMFFRNRFSLLRWPLKPLFEHASNVGDGSALEAHLGKARYSIRLLRYWWAGQALAEEAARLGRPLSVVDLGCERGWLKHFTPPGVVAHWTGLDWNPRFSVLRQAGYNEVLSANADETLPLAAGCADAVVSLHVFEHLPRPGATISEVSRLLLPGGIFLGGAPTMPGWLAWFRERYFRWRLGRGLIPPGGHITCLSPSRWRRLAAEVGLEVEFAVGSHAARMTGSRIENFLPWVRINQLWGALFPSLGSECYLKARRSGAWAAAPQPLPHGRGRLRLLWAVTAAAALLLLVAAGERWMPGADVNERLQTCRLSQWLGEHQAGNDHFIVVADRAIPAHIGVRRDATEVATPEEALQKLIQNRHAHILVGASELRQWSKAQWPANLVVDDRLTAHGADYLLLKMPREQSQAKITN